jgi:hypothetical protein
MRAPISNPRQKEKQERRDLVYLLIKQMKGGGSTASCNALFLTSTRDIG